MARTRENAYKPEITDHKENDEVIGVILFKIEGAMDKTIEA
jgi:hypothetical protein